MITVNHGYKVRGINLARDFSRFPAGRYRQDGEWSGQRFREDILEPSLRANELTSVVIGGTVAGIPSSFIDEAFGGLVRESGFTYKYLRSHLMIVSTSNLYDEYVRQSWQSIEESWDTQENEGRYGYGCN